MKNKKRKGMAGILAAFLVIWNLAGAGFAAEADDPAPDGAAPTVRTGRVNVWDGNYLHLRAGSGLDQRILGHLLTGDELEIVGKEGDWYQVIVRERTGYVYQDYVEVEEAKAAPSREDAAPGERPGPQEAERQTEPEEGKPHGDEEAVLLSSFPEDGEEPAADVPKAVPKTTPEAVPETTLKSEPETMPETVSEAALTPDGNLTLVDDASENQEDGSGKQFLTVTTKDGNFFYLIVDRDKKGNENVHFLNLVDEADLLALIDEEELAAVSPAEPEPPAETVSEPAEPEAAEDRDPPDRNEASPRYPVSAVLIAAVCVGGGLVLFVRQKKKQNAQKQEPPDPDGDYVDGEDEADFDIPDDVDDAADEEDDGTLFDAEDHEPV